MADYFIACRSVVTERLVSKQIDIDQLIRRKSDEKVIFACVRANVFFGLG